MHVVRRSLVGWVAALAVLVTAGLVVVPSRAVAAGRQFSGLAATSSGEGYVLAATSGEMYAFGNAAGRSNPTNFAGRVTDVAVTADGRGSLAVTSAGQFYAAGTATAQRNPTGFSGEIVGVALTADGRGAMAVSSAGQLYAYGTAKAQPNPTGFSGRIVGVALTADGQGAMAVSSTGQLYAYGTAKAQPNPSGFAGEIVDVALTADGRGAMALSSAGQFYASGSAKAQPNPSGFTGRMVRLSLTGGGEGVAALSSIGQVYAYGSVAHRGNGDYGCTKYSGVEVCLEIRRKYQSFGGAAGLLGSPTSGEFVAGNGRGLGMHFQNGSIYWSPSTGAHVVQGRIRDKWGSMGWENGATGFPTSDEFDASGLGRASHFENASIYWSLSTGARAVSAAMRSEWARRGWEGGALGMPITDARVGLAGFTEPAGWPRRTEVQFFSGGSISSDATGARSAVEPDAISAKGEAVTISQLELVDFMRVVNNRPKVSQPIDYTNNGCSGPTYGDVESTFKDACLRHDFGARNFGPHGLGLDPSGARLDKVNQTFLSDMEQLCASKGNPILINNGIGKPTPCLISAELVYEAVYYTATNGTPVWRWW